MLAWHEWPIRMMNVATEVAWDRALGPERRPTLAPTPRAVVASEGTARLLRFVGADRPRDPKRRPLLLVPSIINRWYVMDLRPTRSLVEALVADGVDTYLLDWGVPRDEDRYLGWDDLIARLERAIRIVRRNTGADRIGLLGYCMGATLAAIAAARSPEHIAKFVNLLGPIDFAAAGELAHAVDPRWFDVDAIADAGNVSPQQMQAGFLAMRPTQQIAKMVGLFDRRDDNEAVRGFAALEAWAGDNIPFPARAYRRYIREMYQDNALVGGSHRVNGERVDLGRITSDVLCVVASADTICPPDAATALIEHANPASSEVLRLPGGHVGAVVGRRAPTALYAPLIDWIG